MRVVSVQSDQMLTGVLHRAQIASWGKTIYSRQKIQKCVLNLCCQCYCQYYQCCQYWVLLHRCGATPKLSFAGEMGVSLQHREHLKPLTIFWTYLIVKVHHHFSCVLLDTENLAQLRYSASNTMNNCSNKNLPKETKWQKKSVQNLRPAVLSLWWRPLLFL